MITDTKDAPMPAGVVAMTKQELWNWFHRSQCAAAESRYLQERFFHTTTGLHPSRASMLGDPHAIIAAQRQRVSGLEQQMGEMQKGYDKKLRRAVTVAQAPGAAALALLERVRDSFLFAEDDGTVGVSPEIDSVLFDAICALLPPVVTAVAPAPVASQPPPAPATAG